MEDLREDCKHNHKYLRIRQRHMVQSVTGVDDLNQTIELLLSKRIDATLNAEVVFNDYKKGVRIQTSRLQPTPDQVEEIAIPDP